MPTVDIAGTNDTMTVEIEAFAEYFRNLLASDPQDHFHQLGIALVDCRKGWVKLSLENRVTLIGNPDTGAIHGGAITALLDTCAGFAAGTVRDELRMGPTVDLRIDYMRSAEPGKLIYAEAEVYRKTRNIIFTRGHAYQHDRSRPVAHCVSNFAVIQSRASDANTGGGPAR
jgi:uncharacterized protein (TIGR00369 family)